MVILYVQYGSAPPLPQHGFNLKRKREKKDSCSHQLLNHMSLSNSFLVYVASDRSAVA